MAAAFDYHLQRAECGDLVSQNYVGYLYDKGKNGAEKNAEKAVYWFQKAAEQHSSYANLYLGYMYEKGRGVPKDYIKAFQLYKLAADAADEPEAFSAVAWIWESRMNNFTEAIEWYKRGADAGIPAAQLRLAFLYELGKPGVPQDIQRSARYYQDFEENEETAKYVKQLFEAVDENQYPEDLFALGLLHEKGLAGLKQDHVLALAWYHLSAGAGYDEANYKQRDLATPDFARRMATGRTPMTRAQLTEAEGFVSEFLAAIEEEKSALSVTQRCLAEQQQRQQQQQQSDEADANDSTVPGTYF